MQRQLLLFFRTDELGERRFQIPARADVLQNSMARLQREVPYVTLLAPNPASCAVTARVSQDRTADFVAYLESQSDWITYELDETGILRAAQW
jgi:hypothetical protein